MDAAIRWRWVLFGALLLGCGDQNTRPFGSPPPEAGNATQFNAAGDDGDHAGHDHADESGLDGLPLASTGQSSEIELERDSQGLEASGRAIFERAFRASFTTDRDRRDYQSARSDFQALLDQDPEFAPAWRGLGYALFNLGDGAGALTAYQRAVTIDPEYGEAHYALSFLYVMTDKEAGRPHFERAMELGVGDERNLGTRFYGSSQYGQ